MANEPEPGQPGAAGRATQGVARPAEPVAMFVNMFDRPDADDDPDEWRFPADTPEHPMPLQLIRLS